VYNPGTVVKSKSATVLGPLLELLFPGSCLLCGGGLLGRAAPFFPVCGLCLAGLEPLSAPRRCRICSAPLVSEDGTCTRCRERDYSFDSSFSLFEYRGSIRELIFQYKFRQRRRAARVIAHLLGAPYLSRYGSLPAVPVPGNPKRVRRRGWDPMREVGRALEAAGGISVLNLLRRGPSREQKALDFEQRIANVRGTVALRSGAPPVPRELVLLDDIFTTGATASECARVLKVAGARFVGVLTLAMD
jgi:ComF family protein